jgi:hypothetical protein
MGVDEIEQAAEAGWYALGLQLIDDGVLPARPASLVKGPLKRALVKALEAGRAEITVNLEGLDDGPTSGVPTEEHITSAGSVSDQTGVGRGGAEFRAACSCGWRGDNRAKRAEAQQDGIDHRRKVLAPDDGAEHREIYKQVTRDTWQTRDSYAYRRADGAVLCSCGEPYSLHNAERFAGSTRDLADSPLTLHRLCDGSLVKL